MRSEPREAKMAKKKRTYPVELAQRAADGLEVTLYWHGGDTLSVQVSDSRTGVLLDIPAPPDEALDVYYHPFAHAPVAELETVACAE
jgi:hypothetical protein